MTTEQSLYIGLDLGGTTYKALAVDRQGTIRARIQGDTPTEGGPETLIEQLMAAVDRLYAEARAAGKLMAIGFGIPGILDLHAGIVRRSPNLPQLLQVDLRSAFAQHLRVPFTIDNDANAAALGEVWLGAGRGLQHCVVLTLGTGVGGGVVQDGVVLHGTHGYAGELGHTVVDPSGPVCGCGSYGCLEQYASGTAIARLAEPHYGRMSARDLAVAARRGEPQAVDIFRQVGRALGVASASFANLLNPQRLIIGGAVGNAFDLFSAALHETMRQRTFAEVFEDLRIVPAQCGADAGALGAAYQAIQITTLP